jgi:hypothetical protein
MSRRSTSPRLLGLLLVGTAAVSACSSDDDGASASTAGSTPSTTQAESPTTTTTTTTMPPVDDATIIGEVGTSPPFEPEVLDAGWYGHELFASFGFELAEPVQVTLATPRNVMLGDPSWPLGPRTADVVFLEFEGLVPPELVADESARNIDGPTYLEAVVPIPVDVQAWADAIPNVSITDEGTIDAPGATVRWWDISVDADGPTFRCAADTADCIGAVVTPPDSGVGVRPLDAENLERIYLIDELPNVIGYVSARELEFFDRGTAIMAMITGSLRPLA